MSALHDSINHVLDKFHTHHRHNVRKFITVVLFYVAATLWYYNEEEHWSITDCIFFITVTITTVGYGDFHPSSDLSRMVTVLVILFGLIVIFGMISDFANFVLDYAEKTAKKISKQSPKSLADDPYKYIRSYVYTVATLLTVVLISSIFLYKVEGWTFAEAFYFSIVTTTTVGYGDMDLEHQESKIFLIFYIPISVVCVAGALGQLVSINMEKKAEEKRLAMLARKLDFGMLRELDKDGSGVDKCQFVVAMLVQAGKVDKEEDVDHWLRKFDELDVDGSGTLDQDDIAMMERQEAERAAEMAGLVAEVVKARELSISSTASGAAAGLAGDSSVRTPLMTQQQPTPPPSYDHP